MPALLAVTDRQVGEDGTFGLRRKVVTFVVLGRLTLVTRN